MKRFLPLVFAAFAGSGLAAFAAPQAAPPKPRDAAEATVRALDVLCVSPAGRDISMPHGFEYWGTFSEFATAEGDLEVRPGGACGLTYRGTGAGAEAVSAAIDHWADSRGMERPAALRMDRYVRYGAGTVEWRFVPSAAADTGIVEITYWPESIRARPEKAATTCS